MTRDGFRFPLLAMVVAGAAVLGSACRPGQPSADQSTTGDRVESPLPPPRETGGMPLAESLARRRSHREFAVRALAPEQIAQLCWAAQGISDKDHDRRTAPSAGALYPLTLYLVDSAGVHEYAPQTHSLRSAAIGDLRASLQRATLDQPAIGQAPACFVIAIDVSRTRAKYGADAERYCWIEAGHAAQNLLLQATALGLVAVPIGAVDEGGVRRLLSLPANQQPVYCIPVGHAAENAAHVPLKSLRDRGFGAPLTAR